MAKKTDKLHSKQGKAAGRPKKSDAPKDEAGSPGQKSPAEEDYKAADSSSGITVVGMGGSAGAFEPLKTFFTGMPADSGVAFVVIQHLLPTQESLLPELLSQHTRMRVVQARDAASLEPNCVYVIPPNQYLAVREGFLHLVAPVKQGGIRMPIDFFFRSLAEDRQELAVCILFSGAGSDGTLGVRAVRGAGGLSIAQDPQTAQFSDMPRSAVATGMVDFVLSPDRMPEVLMNYLRHPYARGAEQADVIVEGKQGNLHDILALLLAQKGLDFQSYKQSTIVRRIERRMGLHHIPDLAQYYHLVRQDTDELKQLLKDLLINVTSFFRDAEAFEELRQKVIAPLVKLRQTDEPLRLWVAGCSSGEEAYSLAMLLKEEVAADGKDCPVQIYATDADEEALELARKGIYPESIAEDVEPERLSRFFVRKDQSYQVSESIRKLVVFAVQNLITDPPFSRVDIISCRNLLIYLDADRQGKLIELFNFALNPGGYLFLGKSEGVSGRKDLFDVVSKKARLYRRLIPPGPIVLDTPILPGKKMVLMPAVPRGLRPTADGSADLIRQALLSHFAASVVLVDLKGQIMQFHGQTGKYLNMPAADPILNIRDIAKAGLSARLLGAMHKAAQDGNTVVLDNVPVTRDEGGPFVRVTIAPASRRGEAPPLLTVIFEDVPRPSPSKAIQTEGSGSETVIKQLEDELRATQQELQYSTEDLQVSNEELRVANEEVVSSNEELQSTVEELETSKEELQSVNEELTTVNSELHDKVERLAKANSDMDNFLKATNIATLFLDSELRIRFFTPVTTRILKLIPSDTGRAISDLSMNFIGYELPSDALAVTRGAAAIEREVLHADGSYYLVRVMPYHTKENLIDGVVVIFSDITRLRQAEKHIRRLAVAVKDSNDAVILFDRAGKILAWNRGARNLYGWNENEALGITIQDMTPPDRAPEAEDLLRRMIAGEAVASLETVRKKKDGSLIDVWLTVTAVWDESGKMLEAIATTERDITGRKLVEEKINDLNEQLKRQVAQLDAANKELEAFSYSVSHDLRAPLRHLSGFVELLKKRLREVDSTDVKSSDYMDMIGMASKKMGTLIDDLLNFARLGRSEMQMRKVNLKTLVREVVCEVQEDQPERKIRWEIDELPDVFGDQSLLRLVMVNLVSNAVKFTSSRPQAEIKIGCKDEGDEVTCSVTDNGAGFDMKYVDKIFGVFQRLHGHNEFEGTGIGLANVQRIIARHGGRVWAEGAVGRGAVFHFTLPKLRET